MSAAVKKTSTKPAKSSKSSTKPTTKKAATKAPVPETPTPAPVSNPLPQATASNEVVASEPVVTIESSMNELLTDFSSSIQSLTLALNKLKNDFRTLEKHVLKEARSMDKVNAKRNKNKGSRAPSGFVKPTKISKDLAKFLGKSEDTLMSRTDVTKLITAYVKEHKLQDSENGRRIKPDAKLKSLLNVKANDEVTYFNLQSYMKSHFIKA